MPLSPRSWDQTHHSKVWGVQCHPEDYGGLYSVLDLQTNLSSVLTEATHTANDREMPLWAAAPIREVNITPWTRQERGREVHSPQVPQSSCPVILAALIFISCYTETPTEWSIRSTQGFCLYGKWNLLKLCFCVWQEAAAMNLSLGRNNFASQNTTKLFKPIQWDRTECFISVNLNLVLDKIIC